MALLSSSKKAEQFAQLLDGTGGDQVSGELAQLQGLTERLSNVPQPRAEFTSALRDRLLHEAATTLPGASGTGGPGSPGAGSSSGPTQPPGSAASGTSGTGASSATGTSGTTGAGGTAGSTGAAGSGTTSAFTGALTHTAPLWTQLAAGAAAATIAVTGVTVGASRALPGDLLYGVKRQVEVIQLDLAGSRDDQALANLGFARARLHEMSALLNREGGSNTALSPDLQNRIRDLMESWAGATSAGTTTLLASLRGTPADATRLREALTSFTQDAAQGLAVVVQQLPDATLQSLTGSAFAYLQRVDTALGSPVDLTRLLPSLGLDLPSAPAPAPAASPPTAPSASPSSKPGAASSGNSSSSSGSSTSSSGTGSSGRSPGGSSAGSPSSVPTLPIPGSGGTSVQVPSRGSSTPKAPSVPRNPLGNTTGRVGTTAGGAAGAASDTVNGVLQGVTGKGPGLHLPTSVPTLPGTSR